MLLFKPIVYLNIIFDRMLNLEEFPNLNEVLAIVKLWKKIKYPNLKSCVLLYSGTIRIIRWATTSIFWSRTHASCGSIWLQIETSCLSVIFANVWLQFRSHQLFWPKHSVEYLKDVWFAKKHHVTQEEMQ